MRVAGNTIFWSGLSDPAMNCWFGSSLSYSEAKLSCSTFDSKIKHPELTSHDTELLGGNHETV